MFLVIGDKFLNLNHISAIDFCTTSNVPSITVFFSNGNAENLTLSQAEKEALLNKVRNAKSANVIN